MKLVLNNVIPSGYRQDFGHALSVVQLVLEKDSNKI